MAPVPDQEASGGGTSSSSSSSGSNAAALTRKAAVGTLVTVVLRLASFVGTQWCYRQLDPTALGRANVRLELLLTSILFVSREGFRLALTRNLVVSSSSSSSKGSNHNGSHTTTNPNFGVAWWTIPVSVLVSMTMLLWHLYSSTPKEGIMTRDELDYQRGGILYCLAAAMEGCAEPAVLYFLQALSVAEKASAESLVKTATTVLALHHVHASAWPVTSLGVAQVAYAVTYFMFLCTRVWKHWPQLYQSMASPWHGPTIYLTFIFTIQGVLKFALTEGDRIVLTLLAGSYDQGVYAMGSAYGGLAARLILQPLEETARLLFSRLASSSSSPSSSPAATVDTKPSSSKHTDTKNGAESSEPAATMAAARPAADDPMLWLSYTVLVKMVLYVGLIFSCLAVNYTFILLHLLAGRTWGGNDQAVAVLSAFCVYTAFLAGNGMTEAFCYGIATSASDVGRLGVAHTVTGISFAILAPWGVHRAGTVGLVAANCVAMGGRALFSVQFAVRYFASRQKKTVPMVRAELRRQLLPAPVVLVAFGAAYLATRVSAQQMAMQVAAHGLQGVSVAWLQLAVQHIGVGVASGIGVLSLAFTVETNFRRNAATLWHDKSA
jgi:oligosaccharide translocation protein RFT1